MGSATIPREMLRPIPGSLNFVMVFALACLTGCANTSPEDASLKAKPLLLVNGVVNDHGWRLVESIRVYDDGDYLLTMLYWKGKHSTKEYYGRVPLALLNELKQVTRSAEVVLVSSVPTYSYRLEDSHHHNPEAIAKLVAAVHENAISANPF